MTTHENGAIETPEWDIRHVVHVTPGDFAWLMCPCDSGCDLCRTPEATGYGTYPPPNAVLGEN